MSDPYFQKLFADRIGGADYGKGTEIYKFEKIKRAKRKALAEHPERKLIDFGIGENDEMAAAASAASWPRRSTSPRTAATPTTASPAFKEAVGPLHAAGVRRRTRSGDGDQPLHRHQAGPGHAAGRVHQPGRRDADDRARLSGGRHAHQVLRRRGVPPAAVGRERLFPRPGRHSRRHSPPGEAAGDQLSQQSRPAGWPRASSTRG